MPNSMRIAVVFCGIISVIGCTPLAERLPTVTIPEIHPREASNLIVEEMRNRGYHSYTLYHFWRRVDPKDPRGGAPQPQGKPEVWDEEHISYFELPQGDGLSISVRMFLIKKRAGETESRTDVTELHFNQLQAELEDLRGKLLSQRTYTRHKPPAKTPGQ